MRVRQGISAFCSNRIHGLSARSAGAWKRACLQIMKTDGMGYFFAYFVDAGEPFRCVSLSRDLCILWLQNQLFVRKICEHIKKGMPKSDANRWQGLTC